MALSCHEPVSWLFWRDLVGGSLVKERSSHECSDSAAWWSLVLAPLQPRVSEQFALCHTGGKTVLLVGASGAVGAALQCMLQREGAVTVSCQWKAPQLQTKVSTLLSAQC